MPEKSGMLAAAGVRLVVGPTAGTTACPKAGVAAAAAKITDRRRSRCFAFMPTPVHGSHVLIAWDQSYQKSEWRTRLSHPIFTVRASCYTGDNQKFK
jgi:hypothetical protein